MKSQGACDLKAYGDKVRALDRSVILSEESLDCVVEDLKQIAESLNKEDEVYEVEHTKHENSGRIELLRNGSPLNCYCVFYDIVRNLVFAEDGSLAKKPMLFVLPDFEKKELNLYEVEV